MVGFGNNFSRCRYTIYLEGVPRKIPNSWISFDVSGTVTSGNEQTGQSDMENVVVHARVSEAYIHVSLMYTTDHIFPVLPIKYLMNKDKNQTTPFKLAAGTKPSVSHLHMLFCAYVVWKATAQMGQRW